MGQGAMFSDRAGVSGCEVDAVAETILPAGWGAIEERPSLLLIGAEPRCPALTAMAAGAGLRLLGGIQPEDIAERLRRTVALDGLLLDLRGARPDDERVEQAIRALRCWPGIGDARLLLVCDLPVLDPVIAALDGSPATILCEASASEIAGALCELARERQDSVHFNDIGRDRETIRLEELSDEVRRLAQTIDRLAQAGLSARTPGLHDTTPVYQIAPSFSGDRLPPRPAPRADTAPAVSREEVLALLQARRLRDRYLPPDLFADPAWDMILDLMAARLAGSRVSVSSLCIAAAVPATTALRWIGQLTERGIFVRSKDPADARRVFIALSDEAAESVESWFAATRRAAMRFEG